MPWAYVASSLEALVCFIGLTADLFTAVNDNKILWCHLMCMMSTKVEIKDSQWKIQIIEEIPMLILSSSLVQCSHHQSKIYHVAHYACTHFCLPYFIGTLRPRQKGQHFADDILKCIFLNENAFWLIFHWILFLRVKLTTFQHWYR